MDSILIVETTKKRDKEKETHSSVKNQTQFSIFFNI